jgi:dTDP-4-dehydrorhamnose 3,5-epimerase
MQAVRTRLDGLVALEPAVYGDQRGFFSETYRAEWNDALGLAPDVRFVQDNHSRSTRGVLRGLHYQVGQAKLVRCARGSILDVWVDLRRGSPTFGAWESAELTDQNARHVYIPNGFAHGFCVTSEIADVTYKVSTYYDPSAEAGIRYDDPDIGIEWPDIELRVSDRDAAAPRLAEVADGLPFEY